MVHVVFKWIVSHKVSWVRVVTAGVLLAAWAPLAAVPALAQLAVVAGVVALALLFETIVYAELRREIRAELGHH